MVEPLQPRDRRVTEARRRGASRAGRPALARGRPAERPRPGSGRRARSGRRSRRRSRCGFSPPSRRRSRSWCCCRLQEFPDPFAPLSLAPSAAQFATVFGDAFYLRVVGRDRSALGAARDRCSPCCSAIPLALWLARLPRALAAARLRGDPDPAPHQRRGPLARHRAAARPRRPDQPGARPRRPAAVQGHALHPRRRRPGAGPGVHALPGAGALRRAPGDLAADARGGRKPGRLARRRASSPSTCRCRCRACGPAS